MGSGFLSMSVHPSACKMPAKIGRSGFWGFLVFVTFFFSQVSCLTAQNPFITVWDLSLDEGSGPNQILFYGYFNLEEVDYSWQELSPGNSSGSGQLGLKEGSSFSFRGYLKTPL
jgi:hypothetical protein